MQAFAVVTDARPRPVSRRGVILDLDDTLYPRERFVRSGFAAVAAELQGRLGVPAGAAFQTLSSAFLHGKAGREFQVLCRNFQLDPIEIDTMVRTFRQHEPRVWLPYESREALRRLRADGWRIAILTNGVPSVQAAKVAALALAPMVDHVVYADAVVAGGKPSPEAYEAARALLDVPTERCVAVGDDAAADIAGGKAAGLRTIRLARPSTPVDANDEADIVIHNIQALPAAAPAALNKVSLDVA